MLKKGLYLILENRIHYKNQNKNNNKYHSQNFRLFILIIFKKFRNNINLKLKLKKLK